MTVITTVVVGIVLPLVTSQTALPKAMVERIGERHYRHEGRVFDFAVSPTGRFIAAAGIAELGGEYGEDEEIVIWDTQTGKESRTFRIDGRHCDGLAFSPDGNKIATIEGAVCRLWNLETGMQETPGAGGLNQYVVRIEFLPNGELFALRAVPNENDLQVIDVSRATKLTTIPIADEDIIFNQYSTAFSADGKLLLIAEQVNAKCRISLFNLRNGMRVATRLVSSGESLPSLSFSANGRGVAAFAEKNRVTVIDVSTGDVMRRIAEKGVARCLGISPGAKFLVTATTTIYTSALTRGITLYSLDSGRMILQSDLLATVAHYAKFSRDSAIVVLAPRYANIYSFAVWNTSTIKRLDKSAGHLGAVMSLSFSPKGKRLVSAGLDGSVRVWNVRDGRQLALLSRAPTNGKAVAFSPDGKYVAATGTHSRVTLWDAHNYEPKHVVAMCESGGIATSLAFSSRGEYLAAGALFEGGRMILINPDAPPVRRFGTIELWRTSDLKDFPFVTEPGKFQPSSVGGGMSEFRAGVVSLAFGQEDTVLVTGGGERKGIISVWAIPDGTLIHQIKERPSPVGSVVISRDGRNFASAGSSIIRDFQYYGKDLGPFRRKYYRESDAVVHLWDSKDASSVGKLSGHKNSITCLAMSPDGRKLASGSVDQTVVLWDLKSQKVLARIKGIQGAVTSVAFSPDGNQLAIGSSDCTIAIWHIETVLKMTGALP